MLRNDASPDHPPYFRRVWACRGLLWAWEPVALPALLRALDDEAWRVREMAAKVVARHLVGEAFEPSRGGGATPSPGCAPRPSVPW